VYRPAAVSVRTASIDPMHRLPWVLAAALLLPLGIAGPARAADGDAGPQAAAAALKRCDISGRERRLGATYVTSLSASGVSCSYAERLVRAFHRCRRRNGGADGRCRRVLRFRCSERRTSSPVQYDSRTSCRRGGDRVVFRYTQNT